MSLRVAFDLDGTLADMASVLRDRATALFGQPDAVDPVSLDQAADDPAPAGMPASPSLTAAQQRQVWDEVRRIDDFWTTLPELEPGAVSRLAAVALARRWEVLFITTRPASAGDTTQRQTQRWLEAHGFQLPSVYVLQRSRGRLADVLQLDAVVDDREEQCLDVAMDSKARPVLIWPGDRPLPDHLSRMGIHAVPAPSAAIAYLERLDDGRTGPSVARTIRRWLGRDEPAP